jgi:glycosyltransferase involved in cell wall biosynthesis
VVATDVCGVKELIRDGESGIVVPPDDPEALATGIMALLDDPGLAMRYGRRLRSVVAEQFTLDATSRKYLALAGYPAS